jgi:hypothetical protein
VRIELLPTCLAWGAGACPRTNPAGAARVVLGRREEGLSLISTPPSLVTFAKASPPT